MAEAAVELPYSSPDPGQLPDSLFGMTAGEYQRQCLATGTRALMCALCLKQMGENACAQAEQLRAQRLLLTSGALEEWLLSLQPLSMLVEAD